MKEQSMVPDFSPHRLCKGAENLCIGVNFYAESRDQKSFTKFENFTLSWTKI